MPSLGCDINFLPISSTLEEHEQTDIPEAGDRLATAVPQAVNESLMDVPREEKGDTLEDATGKTTLMLCNLPNYYTRALLLDLLQSEGFADHVRLVYIPMNLRGQGSFGYAFVDFASMYAANWCKERLEGFTRWSEPSEKVMEIRWSETQGLDEHVERYRNSPLMHESVDDELKPALYSNGVRVVFPKPTKHIRKPRLRKPIG
jgi:hypothetical protein